VAPTADSPSPPGWEALTQTMYAELRDLAGSMMRSERAGHTLQPTALANEACLRIARHGLPELPREQRLALAARVLEQVLVDHARKHAAAKRGGGDAIRLQLDENLLSETPAASSEPVDFDALRRALAKLRALHARQAEVVTLRLLAGLTMPQIAGLLGVSTRTIEGDWAVALAWLRRALVADTSGDAP
jgi:RNA polymerase sigma-70 factor (ECF subfamily)